MNGRATVLEQSPLSHKKEKDDEEEVDDNLEGNEDSEEEEEAEEEEEEEEEEDEEEEEEEEEEEGEEESDQVAVGKKRACASCGTSKTPMWRRGPTGKGTLCNACGVRWSLTKNKKPVTKSLRSHDDPKKKEDRRRKHFEKANAIVKGLSKDKKPKKINHNQQHQTPIDEPLDSIDYMGSSGYERGYLRDRRKTKGRQNLSATSVLGQRRASKKEDESESEESDLSDEEEEEEVEEEEEEEDEDESEGEEMILELKNHDKQSPRGQWSRPDKLVSQKPNGKGRGGRGRGGRGRGGRKGFEDLLNGDGFPLSKNSSEGTLEYVRNELRTLRTDLELKEKSGDSVLSQLRLEVLSQLQGARITAEVSLGALKIEIDNDLSSKKDECMRQLYSISSQMEIIKSLLLSDRKLLEEQPGTSPPSPSPSPSTSASTTKSTALSQVERILSIIDSRFSRRVEAVKKIWDQNDGETGVEGVRKVVAENLLKTEKEMCESLQETKGTIKGEYDDIRHRITIIEQCLQHGLLDLDVSKRCADSLSLKATVLGGRGHVALPSPSSLPSPVRESAGTSNGTHSPPSVPSPSSPLVSSAAFVSTPTPTSAPTPALAPVPPAPISTPSYSSSTPTTTSTYSAPAILLMAATNAN